MKREKKKHRTGLRERKTKPALPPQPPFSGPSNPRPAMKIHGEALTQARAKAFIEMFPVAPVPKWVPKAADVQIAMDYAFEPFAGYAGEFGFGEGEFWPGFPYLAELTQRTEYRLISETRAKEMTRKWIKFTYKGDKPDKDKLEKLEQACDKFKVRDVFRLAAEHDGFFGGGHIYPDFGVGDATNKVPLVISDKTIKRGSLKHLRCIEPMWLYPAQYNSTNPLGADYFVPQQWYVQAKTVHHTRLITLISAHMPDLLKPAYSFRGISLSQRAKPYVDNWLRTRQSTSDLLHSFSIVVLKTILGSALAGGAWGGVFDRADVFNATRDNRGLMVIDKETEEMENLAVPLGTIDKLQAQSQEQLAGPSQTPLIKLWGITPAGLNTTSDGEIRVFYDNILAHQEHLFSDPLKKVLDIIQLSEFGEIDENIGFKFEPLWQLDEAGMALVKKTEADIDNLYVEAGAISNEEVRDRLAKDETSQYFGLDLDPADVPEPPEAEETPPSTSGDPAKLAESRSQERSGV